mmetsp:Transcript_743/g.1702  ORF Transcript_743/g.1702 Transcript_743/m.1702 type:complete len:208 (+) Transcript_743:281-904(+)
MLRRLHVDVAILNLSTLLLAGIEGKFVHHEASDARARFAMPLQRNVDKTLEVCSSLLFQSRVVSFDVLRIWATLHLSSSRAGGAVVIEKDAIEDTQFGEPCLPGSLYDPHVRLVRSPNTQSVQHVLRTFDDCVRPGASLLYVVGRVTATKANFQDITELVDVQLVHALLHVWLLPLHHDLHAIHIKELLFSIAVLGEEKAVRPLQEV